MTQGSIERLLIMFALPLLLGQIFQQLYNAVDGVVVGRFVGKEALAAVGASGNIINALISFFTGLGTGSGVVISQYFGAHNDQGVRDTVHTTVVATLILAVVCTILGVTATGTILKGCGIDVAQDQVELVLPGKSDCSEIFHSFRENVP